MEDQYGAHRVPGELELVRQFVNTYDVEDDLDEIGSPQQLRDWLARHGLEPGPAVGEPDVARARSLREALRALTLANNGEPLDPQAIPTLNSVAAAAHLQLRFEKPGETRLEPAGEGTEAALGPHARDRVQRDGRRQLEPAQGVPRAHVPVGLLRPLEEPLGDVVLDEGVRKPCQGTRLPGTPSPDDAPA